MSDTLTKAHIVEAVAEANGYTHKKSVETVETLLELIKSALESGHRIRSDSSTKKSGHIQMVRETERKTEHKIEN